MTSPLYDSDTHSRNLMLHKHNPNGHKAPSPKDTKNGPTELEGLIYAGGKHKDFHNMRTVASQCAIYKPPVGCKDGLR